MLQKINGTNEGMMDGSYFVGRSEIGTVVRASSQVLYTLGGIHLGIIEARGNLISLFVCIHVLEYFVGSPPFPL